MDPEYRCRHNRWEPPRQINQEEEQVSQGWTMGGKLHAASASAATGC